MRFTAWLVLMATLLLWSGNWIVARAVRDEIAPGFATVGRLLVMVCGFGLVFMLPWIAFEVLSHQKLQSGITSPASR